MRRPDLDIFPSCSRTVSFSLSLPLLVGNFLPFFFSFVFLAWFTNLLLLFQKIPNFDSPQILYSSSRSALSLSDLSAASTKRHFLIIFHSFSLSLFFFFFFRYPPNPPHSMFSTETMQRFKMGFPDYIQALEEERRKIQVFPKELPLSLELITQGNQTKLNKNTPFVSFC